MKTLSASEARNSFSELLNDSKRDPVRIEMKGRGVAVLISLQEYERLCDLEDHCWAAQAQKAAKQGFIGKNESERFLKDLFDAGD